MSNFLCNVSVYRFLRDFLEDEERFFRLVSFFFFLPPCPSCLSVNCNNGVGGEDEDGTSVILESLG